MVEGASSQPGASFEMVLEMVRRTAGGAVDADAPLMEAGVDSLGAVELRNQLQAAVGEGVALPSTLAFDHPTVRQLAAALAPTRAASVEAVPFRHASPSAPPRAVGGGVAVGGVSGLLPAGAASQPLAGRVVACGCDAVCEVPAARWDCLLYTSPSPRDRG